VPAAATESHASAIALAEPRADTEQPDEFEAVAAGALPLAGDVDPLEVDDPLVLGVPDVAEPLEKVPLVEAEPLETPEAFDPLDTNVPLEAEPLDTEPLLEASAPTVASEGADASLALPPWIEMFAQ
jgi:hypothetical protein